MPRRSDRGGPDLLVTPGHPRDADLCIELLEPALVAIAL
jgi:hypothetical protein